MGDADLLGVGHSEVGKLPGVKVEPLVSFNSVNSNRCMVLSVVAVLAGSLITNGGVGLLDSGALLLDHVVSEDVVVVAPGRHFFQPQTLLHKRLPVGRPQLVPLLLLAQAVQDALPVGLALEEDCMLGAGVLGFDGLLLGHAYGGVFKVCLKLIRNLLR